MEVNVKLSEKKT